MLLCALAGYPRTRGCGTVAMASGHTQGPARPSTAAVALAGSRVSLSSRRRHCFHCC